MKIHCPNCSETLIAPSEVFGKRVLCTFCGYTFIAPTPIQFDQPSEDIFTSWLEEDYQETIQEELSAHETHEKMLQSTITANHANIALENQSQPSHAELENNTSTNGLVITIIEQGYSEQKKRKQVLSQLCIENIQSWCQLENGEKIRLYIPDVDIQKKEQGLAGIVFTNRHLFYKKYHHQGHIPLHDKNAIIQAKPHDDHFNLTLFKGLSRSRMISITEHNLKRLKKYLENYKIQLKIKTTN